MTDSHDKLRIHVKDTLIVLVVPLSVIPNQELWHLIRYSNWLETFNIP